jgi:hypothetical protein
MDLDRLQQMKSAAKRELSGIPGVEGIGIGDGTLRVYVRDTDVIAQLPRAIEDVELEFVVTGEITASRK